MSVLRGAFHQRNDPEEAPPASPWLHHHDAVRVWHLQAGLPNAYGPPQAHGVARCRGQAVRVQSVQGALPTSLAADAAQDYRPPANQAAHLRRVRQAIWYGERPEDAR